MRYLFGSVFVLMLGVMGCGEFTGECTGYGYTGGCDDDQNVCTSVACVDGVCLYSPLELFGSGPDIVPCELEGGSGFCVNGLCEDDSCDDGNTCHEEVPDLSGTCIGVSSQPDGTPCSLGGVTGVCIVSNCEEDNPCEGVVCDDGDNCTTDRCDYYNYPGECVFTPVGCSDHNQCTEDMCDPETGVCVHTPEPDGTECRLSCSYCECVNGVRTSTTPKPDGTRCSGGLFYTCEDGVCSCEGWISCAF